MLPLRAEILDNDLTQAYIAATIGRDHGWSHIYSLELQRQLFAQLRPHLVFNDGAWFTPGPPYAWLIYPLTYLRPAAAVYVWLALSVVALVVAWWIAAPGSGWRRWLWLLGALAWYPVLYGLSLVQPSLVMVLVVAAAWRLADAQRPYLAGVVLGLAAIKPQYVLALPLVLLIAGHWRIVVPLALIGVVLGAVSLLSLGADGLADYRAVLSHESQMANNRYFTLAYLVGPGPMSYAIPTVIAMITAAGAYLNRHASVARLFALSLVGSTFAATYWHLQDFTLLVPAAWFFWRDQPPLWQRVSLLLVVVGGEFAWGLTPLPVLAGVALWLAYLVAPQVAAPKSLPAAA